jgi:acylphosphatase
MSDAGNEPVVRRDVRFRGRVQGVGFRFATREVAARFRVVGFVQNLADGQVLLSVEGEPAELDRFTAAVVGEMERYVAGYDVEQRPATGEFNDFHVRR